jgi:hypothetical protein
MRIKMYEECRCSSTVLDLDSKRRFAAPKVDLNAMGNRKSCPYRELNPLGLAHSSLQCPLSYTDA